MNKIINDFKKLIISALTLTLFFLLQPAFANSLEDGVNALQQKDFDTAIKALMKNKNNSDGMYWIAEYYSGRYGNRENAKEAFKWMTKAAQKGLVIAHARLGDFYAEGFGTKQSLTKAFDYRKIAAENNHAAAMGLLGYAYVTGKGVKEDKQTGMEWLEKAVANQDLLSHQMLGALILFDNKINPDLKRVEQLITKSWEEGGYYYSAYLLGRLYEDARFEDKNNQKAMDFYKTAAEKGKVTDAMLRLGLMYQNGAFPLQNFSMARDYYQQAYDLGDKNAAQFLANLNESINAIKRDAEVARQAEENKFNQQYSIGTEVCNASGGGAEEYAGTMFGKPYYRKVYGTMEIRAYIERRENEKLQLRTSGIKLIMDVGKSIQLNETQSNWGHLTLNSIFWSDYQAWKPCFKF